MMDNFYFFSTLLQYYRPYNICSSLDCQQFFVELAKESRNLDILGCVRNMLEAIADWFLLVHIQGCPNPFIIPLRLLILHRVCYLFEPMP